MARITLENSKRKYIPANAIKNLKIVAEPIFKGGSDRIIIEATDSRFDTPNELAIAIFQRRISDYRVQYPITLRFSTYGGAVRVIEVGDIEHQLYLKAVGGDLIIEYEKVISHAVSTY